MRQEAGKPRYFYIGHLYEGSNTHRIQVISGGNVIVQSAVHTILYFNATGPDTPVYKVVKELQDFNQKYLDATTTIADGKMVLVGWKMVDDKEVVAKAVEIALGRFPDFAQEYTKSR